MEDRILLDGGLSAELSVAFQRVAQLNSYTGEQLDTAAGWVIRVNDDRNAGELAAQLNALPTRVIDFPLIPRTFVYDTSGLLVVDPTDTAETIINQIEAVPDVDTFYPLVQEVRTTRLIPNDTLFGDQWHLVNTGQSGGTAGVDSNVEVAWDSVTGNGVVVGIVDDGLQGSHPDLSGNYRADLSFDFIDNDSDPSPAAGDSHGTSVAGVAAAEGNNSLGVTGVAFNADLAGIRLITGAPTTDALEASALGYMGQAIDIYNNSWGPVDFSTDFFEGPGPLTIAALQDGVSNGRGGLGSVYVWAAGNGLQNDDNVNYDGYANSRYTIAVAAVDHNGTQSIYSEPGAAILVTAYSDGAADTTVVSGITTTDLIGTDGADLTDYRNDFGGTSSATPMVSGVVALMLETNPNLTWRDVQHILVQSAEMNDATDPDWITNGAGLEINHKYGFGAIDAAAAVASAQNWTTVAAEVTSTTALQTVGINIPDNDATGVTSTVTVADLDNTNVEWVEVVINVSHSRRGDLEIVLTSPSGTESILAEEHGVNDVGGINNWMYTSARHWGESSAGDWTLTVRDRATGETGTFDSWQLITTGTSIVTTTGPIGQVSGIVWQDTNENGIQDDGESGLAGWAIFADYNNNGLPNASEPTGVSAADGSYMLNNVNVGSVTITEVLKPNFTQTFPSSGTHTVNVAENQTVPNISFGNHPAPSQIQGVKWNDINTNGVQDTDEPTVEGWIIYIDENQNDQLDGNELTTETDADGTYTLEVGPGSHVVAEEMIDGVLQTFPGGDGTHTVTVSAGQTVSNINFGNELGSNAISGFVWEDLNGNGLMEMTEPGLSNVIVYLDVDNDGELGIDEPAAFPNKDGTYQFRNIQHGTYSVRYVSTPGWIRTMPAANDSYLLDVGPAEIKDIDFAFQRSLDYGDAPLPYPTATDNEASHTIEPEFYLGTGIDGEIGGVSHLSALGDDSTGDDEDGVALTSLFMPGMPATMNVTASQTGFLHAWMDFNVDGDWQDPGEQIFSNRLLNPGVNSLLIDVPASATLGPTFARFRLSHELDLTYNGSALGGEVEDFGLLIGADTLMVPDPVASDDLFTVDQNSPFNTLAVLENDLLPFGQLTITQASIECSIAACEGGAVEIASGGESLVYMPPPGFIGSQTLTYTISNVIGESDSASVGIEVQPATTESTSKKVRFHLRTANAAGEPIDSVSLGNEFFLQVFSEDVSESGQGLRAAYVDVRYNAQRATTTGSGQHESNFSTAKSADLSTIGVLGEAGGTATAELGTGEHLVLSVSLKALQIGELALDAEPASLSVLTFGSNEPISVAELDLQGTSIQVTGPTNTQDARDVNNDGIVSPIDALILFNEINSRGARSLLVPIPLSELPTGLVDVNGDGYITPLDPLLVINFLNSQVEAEAEPDDNLETQPNALAPEANFGSISSSGTRKNLNVPTVLAVDQAVVEVDLLEPTIEGELERSLGKAADDQDEHTPDCDMIDNVIAMELSKIVAC